MSTILDSLKKSSDKRDGPEKLSIDNFNFSHSKKQSKSGLLVILILIIITAIILAYGYKYINNQVDSAPTQSDMANIKAESPKNSENTKVSSTDKTASTIKPNRIEKPNTEAVKKQLAEKPKTQNDTKSINDNVKKDTNNLAQAKKQDDNQANIKRKAVNNLNTNRQDDLSNIEEPVIDLTPSNLNNGQKKPEPKPEIKKPEYTYVYQLPFSARKEIPKFKLNIHIFDEDPERRVAVINGTKFVVGDLIEEQVLVKEIVREGVLLEYNNYVFLIPNL